MSKYKLLESYLVDSNEDILEMSFDKVAEVVGFSLPRSAYSYASWWSNNPSSSAITSAWLSAGYRSEKVNMLDQTVFFRKISSTEQLFHAGKAYRGGVEKESKDSQASGYFAKLYGSFSDVITIASDTDLTKPIDAGWKSVEEK